MGELVSFPTTKTFNVCSIEYFKNVANTIGDGSLIEVTLHPNFFDGEIVNWYMSFIHFDLKDRHFIKNGEGGAEAFIMAYHTLDEWVAEFRALENQCVDIKLLYAGMEEA